MFNFKALFTATLLAAMATTAWGKAEAVLFASSNCSGADNSGTIGMSTGITYDGTGGYANSVHFYTDGVKELYYFCVRDIKLLMAPALSKPGKRFFGPVAFLQPPCIQTAPRLFLPSDIRTGHPQEHESSRDVFSGQFTEASSLSGPFSDYNGQPYQSNSIPAHIGLGPPPNVRRAAPFTPRLVPSRGQGIRAATTPHLLYGEGSVHSQQATPDIADMIGTLSLRQDQLEEENRVLRGENRALHGRLASVESRETHAAPPVTDTLPPAVADPRLVAATKKKAARRTRKERGVTPLAPTAEAATEQSTAEQSGPRSTPPSGDAAAKYLGNTELPTELLPARRAAQGFVSKTFREVCGVGPKDEWPDPSVTRYNDVTGERYLNPDFDSAVTDPGNCLLISAVARQAELDLQDEQLRPSVLTDLKATWDLSVLERMVRKSFSTFRGQWNVQTDAAAAAKLKAHRKDHRWQQRRILKVDQKRSVVKAFAAEHKLDVKFVESLLHEAHESDEASGPEEDSGESHETWKVRMAATAGISVTSPSALAKLEFLEVLEPEWRSDDLSNIGHALHVKWFNSLSAREKNCIKFIRVRDTHRSQRRIPDYTPWDFGISIPWLDENKKLPENEGLLHDWGTYGNPSGFDATFFDSIRPGNDTPDV
ncbi:hypothetical protein MSAN_00977700 [Mycena sanguinolenta]|uniref:Calpain catalytic domain-containing protein n=1 Tax=Mycena sanguinolenta TaxID=230812 RepID=A0A8H6YVI6_9AGAR|nr:hypothetical protein MSAN_00977700 [Mycena sanguinolenta]